MWRDDEKVSCRVESRSNTTQVRSVSCLLLLFIYFRFDRVGRALGGGEGQWLCLSEAHRYKSVVKIGFYCWIIFFLLLFCRWLRFVFVFVMVVWRRVVFEAATKWFLCRAHGCVCIDDDFHGVINYHWMREGRTKQPITSLFSIPCFCFVSHVLRFGNVAFLYFDFVDFFASVARVSFYCECLLVPFAIVIIVVVVAAGAYISIVIICCWRISKSKLCENKRMKSDGTERS